MTPEKIIMDFIDKMALLEDDKDIGTMVKSKNEAIQAIKQYAKQMCDKQKMQCQINWAKVPNNDEISNGLAIYNAPYPKELQD
jgi:hypothetical protein